MLKVTLKSSVTLIALCIAMPYGKADYNSRCDALPAPIVVERNGPLPEGLSPLARRQADLIQSFSEHTEVIQLSAPNIVVLKYAIAGQRENLIIVELDGREHHFYMLRMRPVVIFGYGHTEEHRHEDIVFVGEYTLRLVKMYRGEKVLGTSIEVSPRNFWGRCDVQ